MLLSVSLACLAVACAQFIGVSAFDSSGPCDGIYSVCRAWQDLKTILGFGCGAVFWYLVRDEINTGIAASAVAADSLLSHEAERRSGVEGLRKEQFFKYVL